MNKIAKNLIVVSLFLFVFGALSIFSRAEAYIVMVDSGVGPIANDNSNVVYPSNNNINTTAKPHINSITPNTLEQRNGNITVGIYGSNFTPNSVAMWNASPRSTTYINANNLTMTLNAGDLRGNGNYPVTVYNQSPGGGTSNEVYFNVTRGVASSGNSNPNTSNQYTNVSNVTTNDTSTTSTTSSTSKADLSDLSASAVFGTNSFLPSGLVQWLFLIVIILLAIILWRKLYSKPQDPHHLKHA